MKRLVALLFLTGVFHAAWAEPLSLHPDNSHYFVFRGKPTVLVTSGEHYGAVLNLDFDYRKYLATLGSDGLNLTRTFSGAYVEPAGSFKITKNTLAPEEGRFICPWSRSGQPGYRNGGNKFDLTKWDSAYFERLRDFLTEADKNNVVVELNLFSPMYKQPQWDYSPMNAANNVNRIGKVGVHEVYTLNKEQALLEVQLAMVRKLVTECNGFGNLYYEVCNEPYFGGVTQAWHDRVAETITETEKDLPKQHLISWNVANKSKKIENPYPAYSIFNFHYANPPTAVAENHGLNKVIGLNETGFKGNSGSHYRMEAWEFLLAGGGLYNNLDYSFAVGHEDGTFQYPETQPGGGNREFRKQIGALKQFVESYDFVKMRPARDLVISKALTTDKGKDTRWQALAEPGKQYALYFKGAAGSRFEIDLPEATYLVEWVDVKDGHPLDSEKMMHSGGAVAFTVPDTPTEIAMRIVHVAPE